jgi:hypothetical protein
MSSAESEAQLNRDLIEYGKRGERPDAAWAAYNAREAARKAGGAVPAAAAPPAGAGPGGVQWPTSPFAGGGEVVPTSKGESEFYQKTLTAFQNSSVIGTVPIDGPRFGITTGSAEEWARFATSVAKEESSFNPNTKNLSDPGGSFGVFQYAHGQVPGGNAFDVDSSIKAFVRDAESSASGGNIRGGILGKRFSTIGRHPERAERSLMKTQPGGPVTQVGGNILPGPVGSTLDIGKPEEPIRDISREMNLRTGGQMGTPQGLMIHHTSGRERGAEGVADVLRKRGLSVQYVIDRDGQISRIAPEGAVAFHAGRLEKSDGKWGNFNLEGVEVIAKSEGDVTDVQREAIARLTADRSAKFGWDPKTSVWGHGELTGRKEADEGRTAKLIREGKIQLPQAGRRALPRGAVPFLTGKEGQITSGGWQDTYLDRKEMDRTLGKEITSKVEGDGKVTVDVNAKKSDEDKGSALKDVPIKRQAQMEPASEGPKELPAGYKAFLGKKPANGKAAVAANGEE